jgi:hypothetical protein
MAWIAAIASIAGGYLSSQSAKKGAKGGQYQPWNAQVADLGYAGFDRGQLNMSYSLPTWRQQDRLAGLQNQALDQYVIGQSDRLGSDFLRESYNNANTGQAANLQGLVNAAGSAPQYSATNFGNLTGNMLGNFDPQAAGQEYTNMLRQGAMPGEQQATASALSGLFNRGRLGTTGGANQMGALQSSQQQADLQRQLAGQQFGLQQQLQQQQGYDAALNAEQGRQIGAFGANQQGMMNQFDMSQGMFGRNLDLYTNSATATQDRFQRALQMFGADNALQQQDLSNFQGLLGAQQSNQQGLLDIGRLGASVGQAQTAANSNAAMLRNQGNQDMIAGFLGAVNAYTSKDK